MAYQFPGELTLGTAPASEPVTTAEAKSHLRVDISDDDTLIDTLVAAARGILEDVSRRTMFTTTWKYILDDWPAEDWIELPRPPLASVTTIKYTDTDGSQSTWDSANYVVETTRTPGRVHLAYNVSWPDANLRPASPIEITYVAGWATTGAIPQKYKQAILMLVGHWYENRETVVATGAVPKELPLAFDSLVLADRAY